MKRTYRALVALLATVFAATLTGAAAPAGADPAPGAPAVAESDLVPGIPQPPLQPYQRDTPDQALPPEIPEAGAERKPWRPVPGPPPASVNARIEYVPPAEVVRDRRTEPACSRSTGPYQRQIESHLRLEVDGRQTPADCEATRAFQAHHRIEPASGFAGPVTASVIRLLDARRSPSAAGRCPVSKARTACVDLSRQLMWVQQGSTVRFGPVPIRSGRAGYATRTGMKRVYWRHKDHWSTLYNSPMPFSQFFDGGQAFHGMYGSIYRPPGSYGCVNLKYFDAKKLWDVLKKNDRVFLWGRKPGT